MFIIVFLLIKLGSTETSSVDSIEVDPHILDNGKLDIDDVPYIVSVQNTIDGIDKEIVCTGFFIGPKWILTSAHCFDGGKFVKTLIKFAIYDYSLNTTNNLLAEMIIKHPYYNNLSLANDIALIRVQLEGSQAEKVKYILADDYGFKWNQSVLEGRNCMAIGYGQINYNDTQLHLMKLTVRYDSQACGCFATNREFLCATPEGPVSEKCFEDNGGPLVCNGLAVGVANRLLQCDRKKSENCGEETFFRYTNLCAYFLWISEYVDSFPDTCFGYRKSLLSYTYRVIPAIEINLVSVLIIYIL